MLYTIKLDTDKSFELQDITDRVSKLIIDNNVKSGICLLYCPHTTAGLTINENADPDVRRDLINAYKEIVPKINFKHAEGNSPSHLMSTLVGNSLNLIIDVTLDDL